jgi:diguanylate cyclase (GGDEF)-like protein
LGGIAFLGVFVASQMESWLTRAPNQAGASLIEAALVGAATLAAAWWVFRRLSGGGSGISLATSGAAWRRDQDPLTHTFSQHGVTVKLIEYLALAERYNRNLAAVLFEIERFADIEAQNGRANAERVLVQLADTIIEHIRTTDRVGRLDNDRFLLVLPETELAGARVVEERIREYARRIEVEAERWRKAHVTVVTGVATFRRGEDINHLLARAEQALAEAKGANPAVDVKAA